MLRATSYLIPHATKYIVLTLHAMHYIVLILHALNYIVWIPLATDNIARCRVRFRFDSTSISLGLYCQHTSRSLGFHAELSPSRLPLVAIAMSFRFQESSLRLECEFISMGTCVWFRFNFCCISIPLRCGFGFTWILHLVHFDATSKVLTQPEWSE